MMRHALARAFAGLLTVGVSASCADVTLSPSTPATIEFSALAAPALAVGDTLRDVDGKAIPVVAIVRNQQGDVLPDAVVRFTYADAARDSALLVDPENGFVVALKALSASGTMARIAARVGNNLQVIRTVLVTVRPDSVDRVDASPIDTVRVAATDTSSAALTVTVRHVEGTAVTRVPNLLVKYELLQPANPNNDSTRAVFLVNDRNRLSNIDTTDATGVAGRFIRVRASQFPVGAAADSAVVQVSVTYRGKPVKGAPVRIVVPVIRKP